LAPPEAKLSTVVRSQQVLPRWMVRSERSPTAMLDRHKGSARSQFETDLDLCRFSRGEIRISPLEDQPRGWLPDLDASRLVNTRFSAHAEGLEDASADAGLEMQDAWTLSTEAKPRATLPPQVNFPG
jgi:hypothetical protein